MPTPTRHRNPAESWAPSRDDERPVVMQPSGYSTLETWAPLQILRMLTRAVTLLGTLRVLLSPKAGAWGFGRIPARDTSDLSGHRVTNASPERVHVPFASLSMVHAAAVRSD